MEPQADLAKTHQLELLDAVYLQIRYSIGFIVDSIKAASSADNCSCGFMPYNGPRELDQGIEKMREHGIMRLTKGRSANHVIQNVHVGIQGEGSH